MNWVLVAGAVAVVALGVFFYLNYWPLRKWVRIKTDPSWRRLARPYVFAPEAEAAEERDLFVSSTVMRDACDIVWHEHEKEPPAALFAPLAFGTVVHVNSKHLAAFVDSVLPRLASEIVLVTGCDDVTTRVPGYRRIVDSPRVLHWFVQNFELDPGCEDRVTRLPVGLNFHKLEPGGDNTSIDMGLASRFGNQQLTLKAIREDIPPLAERPDRVYANFHLNMDTFLRSAEAKKRYRARREALEALRDRPFVFFEPHQIPRNEVWRKHRDFAFEASPHGNGLDCHRTWEALLLKCIPIVKTSPLDPMYEGLPVAIVDDWADVDEARLAAWKARYRDAFDGPIPERLYSRHWIARFHAFKRDAESLDASAGD